MLYTRIGCAAILAFVTAQIAPHKKRHNRQRIGGGRYSVVFRLSRFKSAGAFPLTVNKKILLFGDIVNYYFAIKKNRYNRTFAMCIIIYLYVICL